MASITTAYTVKSGSIPKLLEAMGKAAIPSRCSVEFLNGLGFTSSNDRALISVFKGLGFVDQSGVPTPVYREFMDRTNSRKILARQIRLAYSALFELNTQAQELNTEELKGKLASITGSNERVVKEMASTFSALVKEADFSGPANLVRSPSEGLKSEAAGKEPIVTSPAMQESKQAIASHLNFSHTLNINLPATRDVAVYDAIFKALKEHLL